MHSEPALANFLLADKVKHSESGRPENHGKVDREGDTYSDLLVLPIITDTYIGQCASYLVLEYPATHEKILTGTM